MVSGGMNMSIRKVYFVTEDKNNNTKEISEDKKMRKQLAWMINLTNVLILTMLVTKGYSPVYGAVACTIAVLTILIAVIPAALTPGVVYNDDMDI